MRLHLHLLACTLASPMLGCWLDEPEEPQPERLELPSQPLPLEGSPTAYGMLRVVNELGFAELDDHVGLDRQAAVSIIEHRAGHDGYLGTADDRHVEDIAGLDALYWLGEENLWRVQSYALIEGWAPDGVPDGCEPSLAQALTACRGFVVAATNRSGDAVTAVDASWSCAESSESYSPAAEYFAAMGLVGYFQPALGYHAMLCRDTDGPPCSLGVAGLADQVLPECVAAGG